LVRLRLRLLLRFRRRRMRRRRWRRRRRRLSSLVSLREPARATVAGASAFRTLERAMV
jgi:hypothetical protein